VKLKSICLQTYEKKFGQLSLVTQKLSFSSGMTYSKPISQRDMYPDSFDTDIPFGAMDDEYYDDEYDVYYDYTDDVYYDSDDY